MSNTAPKGNFRTIGFDKLDNERVQQFEGYYLGLVGCPHAYARKELGAILRFMLVRDDGSLITDVVRQRSNMLTTTPVPSRVQVDVKGKKGSGYETYLRIDLDPFDDSHFKSVLEKARVNWFGSAAVLWGDPHCVDVAPCSFYVAKNELSLVYPDQDNPVPMLSEKLLYVRDPMTVAQLTSGGHAPAPQLTAGQGEVVTVTQAAPKPARQR